MEITNKTNRPLRVALPAGKKLYLGPGQKGQVVPKALEHPPLKALIDSGEIEVASGGRSKSGGSADGAGGVNSSQTGSSGGGIRHSGDR